jgi:hypothetical protein
MNKKGAEVYPHALEKEDLCRVIKEVKGEGFIVPSMVPVAEEGKIEAKKCKG